MAAEPSALGAKIKFWPDNTPSEYHTLYHIEDIEKFPEYEVENDAFMALTLHRIRMHRQRILDTGEILPLVTVARADVHGGLRARHDGFHDGPGGEAGMGAQAARPLHAADH